MVTLSRKHKIAPHILVVDGFSGSGKTLISRILMSFDRVEACRIEYHYEGLCYMHHLGKIESDALRFYARMMADSTCYDMMIGRSINFRPDDVTSVLNHPQRDKYISRLFQKEGDGAINQIDTAMPIVHQMTHQCLGVAGPLFDAFEDRLTYIEITRHPLFMVTAWRNYIERYGNDPRELTVCFEYKNQELPWFAYGAEEEYLEASPMDRVVYAIKTLFDLKYKTIAALEKSQRERLLVIPFEKFVRAPEPYLKKMEGLLNTQRTEFTKQALENENVPRKVSNDAPLEDTWVDRYGQKKLDGDATEEQEKQKIWGFVSSEASAQSVQVLKEVCDRYNDHVAGL